MEALQGTLQGAPCFSSLYIGILAATWLTAEVVVLLARFSSLYIGILAATAQEGQRHVLEVLFQFPLHRDPRCNSDFLYTRPGQYEFQFPLHRDPRCN